MKEDTARDRNSWTASLCTSA